MLIPSRRKMILDIFAKNPFAELHLREISRLSGVSLNNVDNSLRLFVRNQMFNRREVSNMVFYRANLEDERLLKMFELLEVERKREFYEKNRQIARLLRKYTQRIVDITNKEIQVVILFGSVARNEWTKNSDIDILAVAATKNRQTDAALTKAKIDVSPLLRINPILTTIAKFVEGFSKKTEFFKELWQDRIVLYNEFLFWQIVKEADKLYA